MLLILTITNTLAIIYLFTNTNRLEFKIEKTRTFYKRTTIAYHLRIYKESKNHSYMSCIFNFKIPIRNGKKTELKEEVEHMIKNPHNNLQKLSAMFSWLKTWEEVEQFEKDYKVVNEKIVQNLVNNFKPKK